MDRFDERDERLTEEKFRFVLQSNYFGFLRHESFIKLFENLEILKSSEKPKHFLFQVEPTCSLTRLCNS